MRRANQCLAAKKDTAHPPIAATLDSTVPVITPKENPPANAKNCLGNPTDVAKTPASKNKIVPGKPLLSTNSPS